MCGVAGIFSVDNIRRDDILSMTQALRHRGPDAQNIFFEENKPVALGHTRLSIIDLSHAADQPMTSDDGRYKIVFNGEIYNYQSLRKELLQENHSIKFKTTSDTETILHAFTQWGCDMVKKLEGMFVILIYDQQLQRLYIFRDRIGKKPLYYFSDAGYYAFASELKALMRNAVVQRKKEVNKRIIGTFLHLGYIPEPDTIYNKIYKFPAGYWGELGKDGVLSIRQYWSIRGYTDPVPTSREISSYDQLKSLLTDAVQKRLMSDVPVGSFLSGGNDSSLVTAIASKLVNKPIKTFSIGFKDRNHNESAYAAAVAQHLKTDHHTYILSEKEAAELIEPFLNHFDEPFADTSGIPTMLVSKLARQEVKVVLTGDGGDELFLGYGAYKWADRLNSSWWNLGKGVIRKLLLLRNISRYERVAGLLESMPQKSMRSHIFSQEQYLFSNNELRHKLLIDNNSDLFEYDEAFLTKTKLSAGDKQAIFDLQYYLKDDLLVKVDRASMYYALECRCPLLDHRLIEYALQAERSLKVRNGEKKWVLKQLLGEYIPSDLIYRPKWGFSVPLAKWLKNELQYLVDDYLNESLIQEVGICNVQYVQELKSRFASGMDYLYNRLWVLIVLHKWWKENA